MRILAHCAAVLWTETFALPADAGPVEDLDPPVLTTVWKLPGGIQLTWLALDDPDKAFKLKRLSFDGRGNTPAITIDPDERIYFDPITTGGPHVYYMWSIGTDYESRPGNALMATDYPRCEAVIINDNPPAIEHHSSCILPDTDI